MINLYNELPLSRYIELYTSETLAKEYKTFEDSIMQQKSKGTSLEPYVQADISLMMNHSCKTKDRQLDMYPLYWTNQ